MANDFIHPNVSDSNAFMAAELIRTARAAREFFVLLRAIQERGFRLFEQGPPLDFAGFEAACGLDPGEGVIVFDLINGSILAMQGTAQNGNAFELMNRVG